MQYEFDWDPRKATANRAKHRVAFEEAMTIFADPLALSMLDPDTSHVEERWISLGMSAAARLVLVVHTYVDTAADCAIIRIISARRPNRSETRQYEGDPDG